MNLSTVKWAQWDKTHSRELLGPFICVCTALCTIVAHNIAQTDLIIFPLTLQTITIAAMMSIWGKGGGTTDRCVCTQALSVLKQQQRETRPARQETCTYVRCSSASAGITAASGSRSSIAWIIALAFTTTFENLNVTRFCWRRFTAAAVQYNRTQTDQRIVLQHVLSVYVAVHVVNLDFKVRRWCR